MYFTYIDESGGFEAPNTSPDATPLMVFAGLIVQASAIPAMTNAFLQLKRRFYPSESSKFLDTMLIEVKGSELRRAVRSTSRRQQRRAIGVLDGAMKLIEEYDVRLVGRVWIKEPSKGLDPQGSYTFAIQDICRHFNHFLARQNSTGLVLCDARRHNQDIQVAHSIFTKKHKASGDAYPRVLESAVFARSVNHAGLQLADIVASALIFPIAARVYCSGHTTGVHVRSRFDVLRRRYATRLRKLQHLYQDECGRTRGGIVVSDKIGKRPSSHLYLPQGSC